MQDLGNGLVLFDGEIVDLNGVRKWEHFDGTTDVSKLSARQLRVYIQQLKQDILLAHWDYQERM